MSSIILVLGGARSGKSSFAEETAAELGGKDVIYLATAQAKDDEMLDRIAKHQADRPAEWEIIEEDKAVSSSLKDLTKASVVLLDCLTLLLANLLLVGQKASGDYSQQEELIYAEINDIIEIARERELELIIVSNEVGQGIVPAYKSGRIYRDIVGRANQMLAAQADEVFITYAGIPIEIKELASKKYGG